jgi:hypothetical protein
VINKSVGAGLAPARLEFQTNLYRVLYPRIKNSNPIVEVVSGRMENVWLSIKFLQALTTNAAALVRRLRQQFSRKLLLHTPTLVLFCRAGFA